MKAITKKPGEDAQEITLDGTLESLQAQVEGLITVVYHEQLDEAGITAYANDEGLLIGQSPNLLVYGQPIVGPVVFVGHDDEGETVGLTPSQEDLVRGFLEAVTLNEAQRAALALRIARMF